MSTELSEFAQLLLARMDTNPEEFIEGDPKHRWGAFSRGIVDWVMGDMDTSSARSLWAFEPHEREALTIKYKAIYLEQQKRAFLKNIIGGEEPKSKRVQITKPSVDRNSLMTIGQVTNQALSVMEQELNKQYSSALLSGTGIANSVLLSNSAQNAITQSTWNDPRALYKNEPDNN